MKLVIVISLFIAGCICNPTNLAAKIVPYDSGTIKADEIPYGTRFVWQENSQNQPIDSGVHIDVQPVQPAQPNIPKTESQLVWSPPLYDASLEQRKEETVAAQAPKVVIPAVTEIKKENKSPKLLPSVDGLFPTVLNEKRRLGDDDKADVVPEVPVANPKKTGGYVIAWPNVFPNVVTQLQPTTLKPENKRVQSAPIASSVTSNEKRIESSGYTPIVFLSSPIQGSSQISANIPQIQIASVPQIPQTSSIYGVSSVPLIQSPIQAPQASITQSGLSGIIGIIHLIPNRPVTEEKHVESVKVESEVVDSPSVFQTVSIGEKKVIGNSQIDLQANPLISWYPSLYAPQSWGVPLNYIAGNNANCDNNAAPKQPQLAPNVANVLGLLSAKPVAPKPQWALLVPQHQSAPKTISKTPIKNTILLNAPINNWQTSIDHLSRIPSLPSLFYGSENHAPIQPVSIEQVKEVDTKWQHSNTGVTNTVSSENGSPIGEVVKPSIVEKPQLYLTQSGVKSR